MSNICDSLKELYVAFDGNADDVATLSNITDILNAIATLFSGEGTATSISEAIQNITTVAANINPEPTLEDKTISPTTSQQTITASSGYDGIGTVTVSAVTAAIDEHIVSGNIKSGVTILGVEGTYTGT